MGTPINTGSEIERHPALKLRNVGDYADVQLIDVRKVGRTVFNSNPPRPMLDANRNQRQQLVLECLYVRGKAAIATDSGDRNPEPDEHVAVFAAGRDWWDSDGDKARTGDVGRSFSGASDHVGGLQTGDVMRWTFEAEIPGQGDQARKVRTFQIRRPKPGDETERAERCEQIRAAATSHTPIGVGAGSGGGGGSHDTSEPF